MEEEKGLGVPAAEFVPTARIYSAEELEALIRGPGVTLRPLTMREFVGHLNMTRHLHDPRATLYDFLESVFRLTDEQREGLFRNLNGSVRSSYNAYVPVRRAIGEITETDREERLSILAEKLNRSERAIMAYLYTIDAHRAFLGAPKGRWRKGGFEN